MGGDGGPQLGDALARRVLVAPGHDGLCRHLGQLGRSIGVGKALAQVEGAGGHGQVGHLGEDRRREGPEPLGGTFCAAGAVTRTMVPVPYGPARIVLTVANFNLHAGVDGWGRPFDPIAVCRDAGRRRARAGGDLDQPKPAARRGRAGRADRRPRWATRS